MHSYPGPSGRFLAKMGAEVIKCEIPPVGDTARNMTPFGYLFREMPPAFSHINPNKYWIGLDLHKPEGQKIFLELAARSDVFRQSPTGSDGKMECRLPPGERRSIRASFIFRKPALASGDRMPKKTGLPMTARLRDYADMPGCRVFQANRP